MSRPFWRRALILLVVGLTALAIYLCAAVDAHGQELPSRPVVMNLGDVIITEARSAGVPVWLAFALADAESGIDPLCVSQNQNGTADLGLFQLNSRYLDEFSTRFNAGVPIDPFDPWTNARVALRLLATLHHVTKTWHGAVAAYNAGLGRWRTGQLPERTLAHIARVFSE